MKKNSNLDKNKQIQFLLHLKKSVHIILIIVLMVCIAHLIIRLTEFGINPSTTIGIILFIIFLRWISHDKKHSTKTSLLLNES